MVAISVLAEILQEINGMPAAAAETTAGTALLLPLTSEPGAKGAEVMSMGLTLLQPAYWLGSMFDLNTPY